MSINVGDYAFTAAERDTLRRQLIHACRSGIEIVEYLDAAGDALVAPVLKRLTAMRDAATKEQP
jgi:hypothetical protein